jgi:hypothetical protein
MIKRRKRFIEAFAKVASKFMVIRDLYGEKLQQAAEDLYKALAENNALELVESTDDLACAMFMLAGLKELGNNAENIAGAFDANAFKVAELLTAGAGTRSNEEKKENENEVD